MTGFGRTMVAKMVYCDLRQFGMEPSIQYIFWPALVNNNHVVLDFIVLENVSKLNIKYIQKIGYIHQYLIVVLKTDHHFNKLVSQCSANKINSIAEYLNL